MQDLNLNTLLAGGIGGITFFAAWLYMMLRWVFSGDIAGGFPFWGF